jgi:hypothetical protein
MESFLWWIWGTLLHIVRRMHHLDDTLERVARLVQHLSCLEEKNYELTAVSFHHLHSHAETRLTLVLLLG